MSVVRLSPGWPSNLKFAAVSSVLMSGGTAVFATVMTSPSRSGSDVASLGNKAMYCSPIAD
jgi:hypothetical protein